MAKSARAFANAPSHSHSTEETAATSSAAPKTNDASTLKSLDLQQRAESFALQAGDDIENIRHVHRAYTCLEKLVVPIRVDDCEEIYPNRSELGALVRLVNEELQRRIEAADSTISSLRDVLCEQVPQ
ncbi:UNVERIFIED_ORG: hypothetical protein J2W38_003144 [Variovorax paradoxus]|nr:hypothetical protein [Variovorax paradoxus]